MPDILILAGVASAAALFTWQLAAHMFSAQVREAESARYRAEVRQDMAEERIAALTEELDQYRNGWWSGSAWFVDDDDDDDDDGEGIIQEVDIYLN